MLLVSPINAGAVNVLIDNRWSRSIDFPNIAQIHELPRGPLVGGGCGVKTCRLAFPEQKPNLVRG